MPSNHHLRRHEPPFHNPHYHHQHHQHQRQHRRNLQIDTTLATRDIAPQGVSSSNGRQPSPNRHAPVPSAHPIHDASNSTHDPYESFLDSQTPVDADMVDQHGTRVLQPRDSHDLSLSPRDVTRDSLVANMLLSLDQFAIGPSSNTPHYEDDDPDSPRFFDIPRYRSNNNSAANVHNWDGQGVETAQQQFSSDLDGPTDDESSRPSNQYPRSRRSNSSTCQDAYPRLNGHRHPPRSRDNHVRGGKGSKSSSLTSIDRAPVHSSGSEDQRWNRGFGRSASFDQGPPPAKSNYPQLEDVPQSPFHSGFANSFLAHDFDAAPTPTVQTGPRRSPSTPSIPPPPPEPADTSSSYRNQSSSRSIKSSSGRSKVANTREAAPSLPATPAAMDLDSAPAPSVGYEKPKDAPKAPASAPQKQEKPGFFKRVFGGGSSKSTPSATADSKRPPHPNPADTGSDSPSSGKLQVHSKPGSTPPSRDTASSHSNHPTLQKKSSSFFRRRKKSTADETPPVPSQADAPPVPPISSIKIDAEKERAVPLAESSPVSSLRQVMNPFLHEGPGSSRAQTPSKSQSALGDITNLSDGEGTGHAEEYKREFSPDYEPSPNARIRKVHSNLDSDRNEPAYTPSKPPVQQESRTNTFLDLDGGSDNDEMMTPTKRSSNVASRDAKDARGHRKDDTLRPRKKKSSRRLPIPSEDSSTLGLPLEGTKAGGQASPRSPRAETPNVRVEMMPDQAPSQALGSLESAKTRSFDEPEFVVGDPTEDDRQKAQKIFDGNEDFIQKEKAASWMGEEGPVRQRTLQAYMELYDFTGQSIVFALRQVCGRLVFRAETQQVDRILVAFSKRWCSCNPNHGFKATDVIHTICYSIMLLNTDLHMADIEQKMTRGQFIKNTMGTITQAVDEAAPNAFEQGSNTLTDKNSMLRPDEPPTPTPAEEKKSFRNSFRPPPRADQAGGAAEGAEECGPLVKTSHSGTMKGWEEQVEIVLKAIYNSIRDERLPLFGADPAKPLSAAPSQNSLSVMGMLKRTPSVLSKAPSEGNLSVRGRVAESRGNASRWASKSRSRPGLGRNGFNSSRTSFDDSNSMWSPAMSSATWSRQSLGRTQTSVSQDSLGSAFPRGDYQQSIGFANALSQAIIRDDDPHGYETAPSIRSADMASSQFLEDESLELTGPPWVKEGIVIHKHHLDGVEKKAKERNWSEVLAVIQKGQMSLFSFTANKSTRQKSRTRAAGPVGGGNWQDNATNVGSFNLRQTLASALPPPGYSRTRPHVWALSLPTGAVHLFQVGTTELIKEFVTTANYWSARLSTHPLVGGISNIEYGWSSSVVNNALVSAINDTPGSTGGRPPRPESSAAHGRKSSVSSFRSASIDQAAAAFTNATGRGNKLPGDRIHIADWSPPSQSLRPSNESEADQLHTLQAYVKGIEEELQSHNKLRSPMLLAFTPRGSNAIKAMANWERKSAYLLREIVKFRTYVDCLQQAESRKHEIYTERSLAQRAARGELTDGDMEVSGGEEEEDDDDDEDEDDVTLRP